MLQAIIVVSFGTKYSLQKEKCIDPCVKAIKEAYPKWQVYESFSSNYFRKRMKEESGITILSPEEILAALKHGGYERVIIQPLFMMAGREYDKLVRIKLSYAPFMYITLGAPLLSDLQDYHDMARAIEERYKKQKVQLLLLGHGNSPEAEKVYKTLQEVIISYLPGTLVITVEERGKISDLPLASQKLLLVPFVMGTRSRVLMKLLEEKEASWRKKLEIDGCEVLMETENLIDFTPIKEIFIRHIQKQML